MPAKEVATGHHWTEHRVTQYRTASGSDRMLPRCPNRTAFNGELSILPGRYRSRFRIERRPFEAIKVGGIILYSES